MSAKSKPLSGGAKLMKRGRPVMAALPDDLHAWFKAAAARAQRSMARHLVYLLMEARDAESQAIGSKRLATKTKNPKK
jgi:hypothetical protein